MSHFPTSSSSAPKMGIDVARPSQRDTLHPNDALRASTSSRKPESSRHPSEKGSSMKSSSRDTVVHSSARSSRYTVLPNSSKGSRDTALPSSPKSSRPRMDSNATIRPIASGSSGYRDSKSSSANVYSDASSTGRRTHKQESSCGHSRAIGASQYAGGQLVKMRESSPLGKSVLSNGDLVRTREIMPSEMSTTSSKSTSGGRLRVPDSIIGSGGHSGDSLAKVFGLSSLVRGMDVKNMQAVDVTTANGTRVQMLNVSAISSSASYKCEVKIAEYKR